MNAGKAVYGILSANSGVTDIVGTNIFPEIAEQETAVPFIVYQLQNVAPEDTHDGPSKLDEVQFEFICYADSYNAAADLGVAVRAALDRVSGTYNGVHVESIQFNDVDVEIEYDPRRYSQVLKFTFRIKRDNVTIALGTPVTGAVLGDLSDVDVTGVTNGQLIAYNSTSGNWEAANDAGGANELSDLSDANVSLPSDGEVLIYSGGEFVNDNIAISNVTGLQAALDAAPDNLRELTDVTISGLADNDYLQYDSASGEWQNSTLIVGRNGEQYTGNYDSEAETLLDGATETVELYYTAQADGDGLHEDAQTDTATTGYDIRRKLYYAEKAQADPNTSGDWTQFADIADDTTYASAKATLLAYLKARTGGTVPISLKMTWEEVAEAPTFTGLLNESYGSGAAAAYSTRRLNGNVTECMVIRRASDSTTTTIGFDSNGNIDESAINTFCSGTTCTVYQWLDQSGNGNTATAAAQANEPTIYTGGAIVKENGRVALDFASDYFDLGDVLDATNGDICAYMVVNPNASTPTYASYISKTAFADVQNRWEFSPNRSNYDPNFNYLITGYQLNVQHVASFEAIGSSALTAYQNGTQAATIDLSTATEITGSPYHTLIGGYGNATATGGAYATYIGKIQEIVSYTVDQSANRTQIESNVGDYFTQNTPLLDTYTGAAAAYSLRKLRSAFSGSAIRVRRASDNTEQDIGFNVFGELDTVSLASFCSGTDGFVAKWYDQASTNDATQTTTGLQPKIYDSSTGVVTENGKPAVEFDGVDDNLLFATTSDTPDLFIVCQTTDTDAILFGRSGSNNPWHFIFQDGSTNITTSAAKSTSGDFGYKNGTLFATNGTTTRDQLHTAFADGNQNLTYWYGLDLLLSGDWIIGKANFGFPYAGKYQEFILYASDQSSNRTNIESNINTFYSIY